jgi:peptidoglycan/xylan/chitin deacetylase (PgdA/CDA1 family)
LEKQWHFSALARIKLLMVAESELWKKVGTIHISSNEGFLRASKKVIAIAKGLLATSKLPSSLQGKVLLTFDDGPHPVVTPKVLDCLDKHSAKAIFFVVGKRIHQAPNLLREIVERGHALGNHSFSHPNDKNLGPIDSYKDIQLCQKLIYDLSGVTPTLYRPPRGSLSPGFVVGSRLSGLNIMTWSLEAEDWKCRSINDAESTAESLVSNISSGDIVLLHDDNEMVLTVLDRLMAGLKISGLKVIDSLSPIY